MKKTILSSLLLSVVLVSSAGAQTIYVDDDATGANDGSSWQDAFIYLQDALDAAHSGDELWAAEGVYKPDLGGDREATFQLKDGVAIYGGFPSGGGNWGDRDANVYETVLSGDLNGDDGPDFANNGENSYHVVTGTYVNASALLDGCKVTGGNANKPLLPPSNWPDFDGGGLYTNHYGSPTVNNCTFVGNYASEDGGGVYFWTGSPRVTNCKVMSNKSEKGAGLCMGNGSPLLINCTISNNTSTDWGGGIYNHNFGTPTIINCAFSDNYATYSGGGMYNSNQSHSTTVNCWFSNNGAGGAGGGMYNEDSNAVVTNCLFTENWANYGGGMNNSSSSPVLTNCIFWTNTATYGSEESQQIRSGTPVVNYCCIQGWTGSLGGVGNTGDDPLFLDAADDDYWPLPGSPCIDAGDNNSVPVDTSDLDGDGNTSERLPWDLQGNPRIVGSIVDIGPYEFDAERPLLQVEPSSINFSYFRGEPEPEPEQLFVSEYSGGVLNWEITEDCDWLNVWPTAGESSGEVNEVAVSVFPGSLEQGQYNCVLTVSDSNALNSPRYVTVNLDVQSPVIGVEPTQIDFYGEEGGPNPEPQVLSVWNDSVGILNWEITEECDWLDVSLTEGNSIGEIDEVTLSADTTGLTWGTYNCSLTILDPNALNSPQTVPVVLHVLGQIVHVPSEYPTIQDAIDDLNIGGTVIVEPNVYTGTGNRDIDFRGKAITVRSTEPNDPNVVAATIIDCNANTSDQHRGFVFESGEASDSVLAGFTIMNGYESAGGGIYCYRSSPTITNCVITANTATGGGGVYCRDSSATITNCIINHNTASGNGGGISCRDDAGLKITNCTISENSASVYGGGVCCIKGTVNGCTITHNTAGGGSYGGGGVYMLDGTVSGCTISENSAISAGGGICSQPNGDVTVTNCYINGNSTDDYGGGLYGCDRVTDCVITGNSANSYNSDGGGLAMCNRVSNCVITGNFAADDGGGARDCSWVNTCIITGNVAAIEGGGMYYRFVGDSTITNCTISGNVAVVASGGGICCSYYWLDTDPTVTNCIVWGNTDSTGVTGESSQISALAPDVTFSCIQDDDPNDANIPFGGEDSNNIDDNPMFVREPNDGGDGWGDDPGTPDVNEGENDDFGDLHLRSSSPCINAGQSAIWLGLEPMDIDGQPRIMGTVVDMGADEFIIPTLVVTKPEGGEVWASGSLHEITWHSLAYEGDVDILFSEDAGSNWGTVESNLPDTGSYMWYLPDIVDSNQCLISAVPSVPDSNSVSVDSGLFTIHPDFVHPAVPSKWESRGGDFTRTGLSENYGPELGCLKWQFETDGPVWASATIGAGDRVHIACGDGRVYTLDLDDGSLLWSYDTNSELLSSPTVGPDGSVFVGSENGKLYAISIGGTLRWTHTTDGWIYSSPAVSDEGDVYVCSQDGTLYALGADGSELWTFEPNDVGLIDVAIFASPAIGADGTVYIAGLYDPNLYALDPNNGSVKWVCNFGTIGGAFASPVVAADGTIYQTLLYDANLYAIDPNTGAIIWSMPMADPCSGWFDSDYVDRRDYVDGWYEPALGPDGTIYVSFNDPYLRAVEPNGNIKWVTRLGMTGSFSLATGNDGIIYAAGEDGYLCAVDANGGEIARFQGDDLLSFPVIAADNTIIVSDVNNRVWAIGGDGCGGQVSVLHRPEDLDGSRAANFTDFAILAMDWLACTDIYSSCNYEGDEIYLTGDIDRNLYVDFADIAALVSRWLSED